jgi:uncharacterized membrane protein (DUF2068 family)
MGSLHICTVHMTTGSREDFRDVRQRGLAVSDNNIPLGLRIIGTFKLFISILLAGIAFGIFRLMGEDIGDAAEHLVLHLHLDPERHWINVALVSLAGIDPSRLKIISAATLVYSILYAIEGIGLLLRKHWAEYMVIIITGSLLPFELYEIAAKVSVIRISVLIVNVVILVYLLIQLKRDRHHSP